MKKFITFCLALTCILSFTLINAQTDKKAQFVKDQNYLSPSALKNYKNAYGDSLQGFDEDAARIDVLKSNPTAEELINVLTAKKRQFINHRYNLNPPSILPTVLIPNTSQPVQQNNNSSSGGSGNKKTIGGNNYVNVAPCNNEDFESTPAGQYATATSIQGWTISSFNYSGAGCLGTGYNPGAAEIWVRNTPIAGVPNIGLLGNSPLGGTKILQMNDFNPTGLHQKISQTFPVTNANTIFQIAFAGVWNDGGHLCCEQPALNIELRDCTGAPLSCSSLSLNPTGTSCSVSNAPPGTYTVSGAYSWTNWQTRYIDLTPYIGQCITIDILNGDCTLGGHAGVLYFDARCGGNLACLTCTLPTSPGGAQNIPGPVSFCSGSGIAQIIAPAGYNSYFWTGPTPIPLSQATLAVITLTNPPVGAAYTVNMVSPSGCPYVSINVISYSQVNIAGIGSSTTCIGGASGSATVVGNGSGTGYNYNWLNAAGNTISTASVATGLASDTYTVIISNAGCGTASTTVFVDSGVAPTQTIYTPYCNNEAYLYPPMSGGSNHQWYNGTTPIPFGSGGGAPSYTVTNPVSNGIYHLSYMSQGCQDYVEYVLQLAQSGALAVTNIGNFCPTLNNGTATISLNPAPNAQAAGGANTFSVFSLSGPTTPYTSTLGPTNNTIFVPTGLTAGTYSVSAFDGFCRYGTSFLLTPQVYNFTINPSNSSVCSGANVVLNPVFSGPANTTQYTYSWSPSTFIPSGLTTNLTGLLLTSIPPGTSSTVVYTLVASSTGGGCSVSNTAAVTVHNPMTPTLLPVPNLCDNSNPYAIVSNPAGSTYSCSVPNLVSSSGVITPTNVVNYGVITYTATQGLSGCEESSVGTFEISKFNTAALISAVAPLCVNNTPVNLMSIVQSTVTGAWNGTGVQSPSSGNYQFSPAGLITNTYIVTYTTSSSPNPTVCPSSSTLGISVTQINVPFITPVNPVCNTNAPFTLTASPSGGNWIGTAVSATGVFNPSVATVPNTPVTYSVADGPCVNSNTINIAVSQFNSAALTGPVPAMCAIGSNPYYLMNIASVQTGTWSGNAVYSNTFYPAGLPTNTYVLTYKTSSYPNAALCPDMSTVVAAVSNPPTASIMQPSTKCSSNPPFQMEVSPAVGAWVTTPYLNSDGLFNPATAIIGNNTVQYIIGTSTCNITLTKYVNVEMFVSAATTTNNLGDKCNTGAIVNLAPICYNTSGTWGGPGIAGYNFNPALSGTGSFILTHQTSSFPSELCPDQATLSVNVYSLATPAVSQVAPMCNSGGPLQLIASPVGGMFNGVNSSAVSTEGVFNPALATVGDNIVSYSITSGPCIAYAQTTVNIEGFVSAEFVNPVSVFCEDAPSINLNSMVQNPGGTWSGNGVQGSMFTPANAVVGNRNTITYRTHSATQDLCPDERSIEIDVRAIPVVDVVSDKSKGCSPLTVAFSIGTKSITSGLMNWYFGNGTESSNELGTEYTFVSPGIYHITYSYIDDYGCRALAGELEHTIQVYDMPKANFSAPDEIRMSSPEVIFTNQTTNLSSGSYSWSIPGLYQGSGFNAGVSFPAAGKYPVTLIATAGAGGCSNSVTKIVEVKTDFNIYIPNSFSPNFDQINETFVPVISSYGSVLQDYEMEIFDRWGHLLFHSKDTAKGWDGTVKGSEAAKEGVYIFRIKFRDPNGIAYNKEGSFTLVR